MCKTNMQLTRNNQIRIFTLTGIVCAIIGISFLILGTNIHELFGITSPVFFVIAIVFAVKTQGRKLMRSTIYIIASAAIGFMGAISVVIAAWIHPVFAYGSMLFIYGALVVGLIGLAITIGSGEIFKFSGILKVLLLFIVACIIARFVVMRLESMRYKSNETSQSVSFPEGF